MKLYLKLLVSIILLQSIGYTMPKSTDVMYIAEMKAKKIYCNFFVNGIPLLSTAGYEAMREYTFSDNASRMLAEGKNTISIQGMDLPVSPEDAYCEMTITAFVENDKMGKGESKDVASIRVSYDKDGKFTVQDSRKYGSPSLTNEPKLIMLGKASFANQAEGLINDALAERELNILHPYKHHSWSYKSTPMTNTPENFKKVWAKYEEFHIAMAAKDRAKILELLELGLSETEVLQGNPGTQFWTNSIMSVFDEAWAAEDFKVIPVDPDDYELIINADGQLFRINYIGAVGPRASPIEYTYNQREGTINPDFTMIDGKVVVAF